MGPRPLPVLAAIACLAALAPTRAAAMPSADAQCRDVIAQQMTRYAATAAKATVRCHQQRSTGARELDVDCNDIDQASNDGRAERALSKARAEILEACQGAPDALDNYTACPIPAAGTDDGGPTSGIDNYDELVTCLAALSDAHASTLAFNAQGTPPERLLDPLRKCQGRLGKGSNRILTTTLAERRRCQAAADVSGNGGFSCDGMDPRARISAASERYRSKTTPHCEFSSDVLEKLAACANTTAGLMDCTVASAMDHGSGLVESFYSLEGTATTSTTTTTTTGGPTTTTTTLPGTPCGSSAPACNGTCANGLTCATGDAGCECVAIGDGPCAPATIRRKIISRYSTEIDSITELNAGWSGLAMHIDFPNKSGDWVDVECDPNCENCEVDLRPVVEDGGTSPCRCTADASKSCSVINGSDPDSCGGLDPTCRCFFGAPLPTVAAGNPACIAFRIRRDYDGTMNLREGSWDDTLSVAAIVYLGLDVAAPCPNCNGDAAANDGLRDGTCTGAGGGACDVNGTHSTFGNLSNDCLPPAASNISGVGLLVTVGLTTGEALLDAELPCDTPAGGDCHCRTCTGNSNQACSEDSQCAEIGAGTCTAAGGAGVRLNQCTDFLCSPNFDCTIGPVDMYCDGKLYPDGRGYIPCTGDGDCENNDAGTCTLQELRHCFPDPVEYTGDASINDPLSVSAFCVAPTSNPAINIASGLPGPGALLLQFDNEVYCKSDPSLPYEFPSGINCGDIGNTTTTTLLPLPPCAEADVPLCGGICPTGQNCADNGGTCGCTGVPVPSCDDTTAPTCGGLCGDPTQVCVDDGGNCDCLVVTLPQCTEAAAPVCGGLCPNGEICSNAGETCECGAAGVPTCGTAVAPSCGGLCDVNQACTFNGTSCTCTTLPVPTCNEATVPLCLGVCSTGSTCGAVGDACQCTGLPIP